MNALLLAIFGFKWFINIYRFITFADKKKSTPAQVFRLKREMDRLLHLEQQGPNMLAILALCYVIFIFFAPKSSFIQSCNSISSKFRVLRIWLSINVFISFIIIPVYALEFCYARTQRNNEAIEKARDLQDEANE